MLENKENSKKVQKLSETESKTEDEKDIENSHPPKEHNVTTDMNVDTTPVLEEHEISYSGDLLFKCIYCHMTLKKRESFTRHMKEVHHMTIEEVRDNINKQFAAKKKKNVEQNLRNDLSSQRGTLLNHENTKDSQKEKVQYSCNICGKQYHSRTVLRYHMRKLHPKIKPNVYVCGICKNTFYSSLYLKMHLYSHKRNKAFNCNECGRSCLSIRALDAHKRKHKSIKHNETDNKNKRTASRNDHDHVVKKVLNEKVETTSQEDCEEVTLFKDKELYTCFHCGQTYPYKAGLALHIRLHFGVKIYKCQICKETLADAGNLKQHSRVHLGDSVYTCNKCGESFPFHKFIKEHIIYTHGERAVTCRICRKVFTEDALKDHLKMHRRDHLTCKICGKTFTTLKKLNYHIPSHSNDRPYECDVCSKTYKTLYRLQRHKLSHKGRLRQCDVCGKSVSYESFNLHMRSHSDVKTFQCEVCSKFFKLKHHLKSHLLIHGDSRKHECEICGFKFKLAHHLRSHLKTAHEKNTTDSITEKK